MRFESTLAKRYIFSQKRHSVLLICSIVIAVGLMSMLFTGYYTFLTVLRAVHYDSAPYHAIISDISAGQGEKLKRRPEVGKIRLEELPGKKDRKRFDAYLTFDQYIGDTTYRPDIDFYGEYITELCDAVDIKPTQIELNDTLLTDDGLTLDAKFITAQRFCIFFIFVLFFAAALRLIIDTAFEVSSKERERQFGVLQSVGATPKQVVRIMTTEGLMLCAVGVPLGAGLGILLGYIAYKAVLSSGVAEIFLKASKIKELIQFHVSPLMVLISAVTGFVWVMFSAYGTGMRVIRKSPVEVITARVNTVKKVKKHTLLGLIFGWIGKLASRNARRQKKRFVITVLSLTVSLTLFASLSSVITKFADTIAESVIISDEFGEERYDFALELKGGESYVDKTGTTHYSPFQQPMDYLEPLKQLEETGYFKNFGYMEMLSGMLPDSPLSNNPNVSIYYLSEYEYERLFEDHAPMTYQELAASDGGILVNTPEDLLPEGTTSFKTNLSCAYTVSKEEFDKHKEEKKDNKDAEDHYHKSSKFFYGDNTEEIYYKYTLEENTFNVIERMTLKNKFGNEEWADEDYAHRIRLVMTMDQWNAGDYKRSGDLFFSKMITCNLKEDSLYSAALHYLLNNKEHYIPEWGYEEGEENDVFDEANWNMYGARKNIRTVFSAIRIGAGFINLMLALIAIVNLVNIVSTGILNRKREFASMQCVGMTPGQLYRMTAVECLQFVLFAVICSIALSSLLIWGTHQFNVAMTLDEDNAKQQVAYLTPIIKVLGASALAYAAALITSLIPLKRMQKEPLVEQIRGVE